MVCVCVCVCRTLRVMDESLPVPPCSAPRALPVSNSISRRDVCVGRVGAFSLPCVAVLMMEDEEALYTLTRS